MPYAQEYIAVFARIKSRIVGVKVTDAVWSETAGELVLHLDNGKFLPISIDKARRATEDPA
jgi:hypothetical protein